MTINNNYKPMQSYAATDKTYWDKLVEQEQAKTNAANVQGFANRQEMMNYAGTQSYSQSGKVQPGGTVVGGVQRPMAAGTSGADEAFLSDQGYAIVQNAKDQYAKATTRAEKDYWHNVAEKERARAGYSGGTDGSMYLNAAPQETTLLYGVPEEYESVYQGSIQSASGASSGSSNVASGTGGDLRNLLSQWQEAALKQSDGRIDYAVAKAVADLERALEDAQPQFKEQAESVAREERQALDNSALYAEVRGDKGGIGQSQYNEIQAAAAQNHLAVQQAQIKLATDTARQIEDLRAQGEFQKADAALQVAQTYLGQLIGIEQWAAEFGLNVEQFQESIRQWEVEFNQAMRQFQVDTDLAYGQLTGVLSGSGGLTIENGQRLSKLGQQLLEAGIMPSNIQLEAMGITLGQAEQLLALYRRGLEEKR